MTYLVTCDCGHPIEVLASSAGDVVACPRCRIGVDVPKLSELREMANLGAYESSALDAIARQIAEGLLPDGKECMISGRPTGDWVEVEISCERTYRKNEGRPSLATSFGGLLGVLVAHFLSRDDGEDEGKVLGRDTTVVVPLRIDREHHRSLGRRWSQRRLRSLLREIPVIASLLAEYPMAQIVACEGRVAEGERGNPMDELFD